ncbi:MAG TPA: neutral/alkaline non-lysosomal ceramidase N-terminal domain-containing protein [Bryobacteraceae bacterium]|jgi:hypothetical protein
MDLLIGAASEIITPDLGCEMAGFAARTGRATGIHDDLHARALVLDNGQTRIALISVELLGVTRALTEAVRARIERDTGIPAQNVVIAATHTHCGPTTFTHFYNQGQPLDESYLVRLADAVVVATHAAYGKRRPASLRSGFVRTEGIAVNRRSDNGLPIDPDAGVLLATGTDGRPIAIAISFACHTTVLGPNTLEISGDYAHYTILELQQEFGAEVLFFNGAEGDISIGHKSNLSAVGVIAPFRTFQKAEEIGVRLARAVSSGLSSLEPEEPVLDVAVRTLQLPLKTYAPLAEMTRRVEQNLAAQEGLSGEELLLTLQRTLFSRIDEYYAALYESADGPEPKTLPFEMTAVRIGNTAMLSFPGEVFVEIALAIRRQVHFKRVLFLGLANGYNGYFPTAEADVSAGYEVVASRVTPAAAATLSAGSVDLVNSLLDRSSAGAKENG